MAAVTIYVTVIKEGGVFKMSEILLIVLIGGTLPISSPPLICSGNRQSCVLPHLPIICNHSFARIHREIAPIIFDFARSVNIDVSA